MTILDEIFAAKREEVASRGEGYWNDAKARALDASPARGFARALRESRHAVSLIAEVKKGSPVKGTIREDFDPVAIARDYEAAGADCLSVLTDSAYFQGSEANLVRCREAVGLPVLRKDFTTSALHVYEARAMGADAVLLIVNGLTDSELRDYRELAEGLGMDALVEAHTLEEAERALGTGASLVGLNNRDLRTFETTLDVSVGVLPRLAGRATLVSESALHSFEDVRRVAAAGARSVLIGTAFCSRPDVGAAVREVMGWSG